MLLLPALTPLEPNRVYCLDALDLLRRLPAGSVNCIVTSPPYFALRNSRYSGIDRR